VEDEPTEDPALVEQNDIWRRLKIGIMSKSSFEQFGSYILTLTVATLSQILVQDLFAE
jgi:hypothetical protein